MVKTWETFDSYGSALSSLSYCLVLLFDGLGQGGTLLGETFPFFA